MSATPLGVVLRRAVSWKLFCGFAQKQSVEKFLGCGLRASQSQPSVTGAGCLQRLEIKREFVRMVLAV